MLYLVTRGQIRALGIYKFCFPQGRLDALWALLRQQYDRVSLMRPQEGDEVCMWGAVAGSGVPGSV